MKYAKCPDCNRLVFAKNVAEQKDKEAIEQDNAPEFALCKKCSAKGNLPTVCSSKSRPPTSDERQGGWE